MQKKHNLLQSNEFCKLLLRWNKKSNNRRMPWKGEKNAYRIWLSEVILQQTRVEQGLQYYEKLIKKFPTIQQLANADDKTVFKLWEGLGYYSRCRNLLATARYITSNLNGVFPNKYEDILKLKGIGPYTAAAIASFAFNLPHAVIDGNVFRVLARVFGIEKAIDTTQGKKYFTELAAHLLDKKHPSIYNQAIMDFGAIVCKPVAPLCTNCVFNKKCVAFFTNRIAVLPVKEKKLIIKNRYFHFFIIHYKNTIAVTERLANDIWQHLYEFPLMETEGNTNTDDVITRAFEAKWISENDEITRISKKFTQKLTHQNISAVFISISTKRKNTIFKNYLWVEKEMLEQFAFPKIINQYLQWVND